MSARMASCIFCKIIKGEKDTFRAAAVEIIRDLGIG